jgi:predicted site-specific integrase-resolvase
MSVRSRSVRVVDDGELDEDLVGAVMGVLTSLLCARMCGDRAARNRAAKALAMAREGDG